MTRIFQVQDERQRDMLSKFVLRQPMPFQAELGPLREQRSLTQNNRLWALHTLASNVTGYTPDEMHEHALCKHFGYTEVPRTDPISGAGVTVRIPLKRSSTRDKKEFAAFMEATEIWYGTEFGVWLE